MICKKCEYEWKPRTENPKACPRCKTRLDWTPNILERIEQKANEKSIKVFKELKKEYTNEVK